MTDRNRGAGELIDERRVLDALSVVRDPELDEPITDLGFVESLDVGDDAISVRLRLPTYFCAPNFAYMMAADAKEAIESLGGRRRVTVFLADHFSSDEINDGLVNGLDFQGTFPEEAGGDLDDLRTLFNRKAFIARQEKICAGLLAEGRSEAELLSMRVGDLPGSPETDTYLERRRELGLATESEAPLVVTAGGEPVPGLELRDHLRFARMVGINIEANAGLCRGLLATRYGLPLPEEATT